MNDSTNTEQAETKKEQHKTETLKEHLKDTGIWKRLLFMILFTILYSAAEVVLAVVVVFQFLTVLITGAKNGKVLSFGAQLSTYTYHVFSYLTFNTEARPYPMGDWPSDKPLAEKATAAAKPKAAPRKPAVKKAPAKKAAPKTEKPAADTAHKAE